jgi:hypothetical protein
MVRLLAPLSSGRDTEIDMIEREMEGGVLVIQPPDVHEHSVDARLGGVISTEEDVQVYEIRSKAGAAPKG